MVDALAQAHDYSTQNNVMGSHRIRNPSLHHVDAMHTRKHADITCTVPVCSIRNWLQAADLPHPLLDLLPTGTCIISATVYLLPLIDSPDHPASQCGSDIHF